MNPPNLSTEESLKAWILTHAAESRTFWRVQIERNSDFEDRLRKLERRVLVLSALGGLLGSGVGRFLF